MPVAQPLGVEFADQSFAHGREEKSRPRPLQTKGSGTLKSQAGQSALTYWSGIIQLGALVSRKNAKGLATRRIFSLTASAADMQRVFFV